jgi:tetratricopeptide (TPR) repeat protein
MKRDYERSLADINEAIRLNPTDANSLNMRGEVYLLKGEWKAALSDLSEAIHLAHQDGLYRVNRNRLYTLLAEYDKLIKTEPKRIVSSTLPAQ